MAPTEKGKKRGPRRNALNSGVVAVTDGERYASRKLKEYGVKGTDAFGRPAEAHEVGIPQGNGELARLQDELKAAGRKWRYRRGARPGMKIEIAAAPRAAQPLCGAKTVKGGRCRRHAVMGGKRCPKHGGLSTGPRTAEGKARVVVAVREYWRLRREAKAAGREFVPARPQYDAATLARGFCAKHLVNECELCALHRGAKSGSHTPEGRARTTEGIRRGHERRRQERAAAELARKKKEEWYSARWDDDDARR